MLYISRSQGKHEQCRLSYRVYLKQQERRAFDRARLAQLVMLRSLTANQGPVAGKCVLKI